MTNLIIPKTHVKDIRVPLIFLAGPIRGAPNWQDEAIEFLLSQNQDLVIASPRRELNSKFKPYLLSGSEDFPRQRAWERYYLDLASKTGAIVFWLPGETNHDCKKAFGAMTRFELAQWSTRYTYDKSVKFCIGTDGNFSEFDTIRYDLSLDAPDKNVFGDLKSTCLEALRLMPRMP